jgi:DNA-binding XRE family transcriptional regulator
MNINIAGNLKRLRKEKGLTQDELADGIEVESVTMGDFQRFQMGKMLSDQKYDPLRSDICFKKICKMFETAGI